MIIKVIRLKQGTESTLASLLVDNQQMGFVLEDTDRGLTSNMPLADIKRIKVQDRTAIPTGRYAVKMTPSKRFNKVMPELLSVPGYGGIRIHKGNYVGNTDGCLLPGKTYDQDKLGYLRVWNSGLVYDPLLAAITAADLRKEPIWCEITRLYSI